MNLIYTKDQLIKYLESNGWALSCNSEKFTHITPPNSLGFDDKFTLPIPINDDYLDINKVKKRQLNFLSKIYEINKSKLLEQITGKPTAYHNVYLFNANGDFETVIMYDEPYLSEVYSVMFYLDYGTVMTINDEFELVITHMDQEGITYGTVTKLWENVQ